MAISGVNNPLTNGLGAIGRPLSPTPGGGAAGGAGLGTRPGALNPGAARPGTSVPIPITRPPAPLGGAQPALPSEAPAGTDPELWSVLTSEERTFFAKSSTSGPLTYGRAAAGVQALQSNTAAATNAFGAASRGGRLDVRA